MIEFDLVCHTCLTPFDLAQRTSVFAKCEPHASESSRIMVSALQKNMLCVIALSLLGARVFRCANIQKCIQVFPDTSDILPTYFHILQKTSKNTSQNTSKNTSQNDFQIPHKYFQTVSNIYWFCAQARAP
jgi:hypothetical protein